jgi:hypothetical protein
VAALTDQPTSPFFLGGTDFGGIGPGLVQLVGPEYPLFLQIQSSRTILRPDEETAQVKTEEKIKRELQVKTFPNFLASI